MASQLTPLPEVERLSPRCIRILGGNPGKFTLQGTNTYLVGTGARRLLVDTGEGMASWAAALRRTLDEEGKEQKQGAAPGADPVTLAAVLITHWHPDHVGGIGQVREVVPGVPVYQRRRRENEDEPDRDGADADADLLDIPDNHCFAVEGATLRAVHTPGHATNHVVFVLEEEGAVLAGDNVLGQGTAVFEDLAVYLQSLARMRALYGDGGGRRLYPAHGPVVEDGPAKITEYIAHRQQREDQVVQLLRGGETAAAAGAAARTPLQLVEVMYADVRRDLYDAAARGVLQILQKLEGEGRVVQDGQGAWQWKDRSPL